MGIQIDNTTVNFEGVIYEDVIASLREMMQNSAPEELTFNFSTCDDLHLAVIQVLLAYKKLYTCSYIFGDDVKIYQKVLTGFHTSEEYCN